MLYCLMELYKMLGKQDFIDASFQLPDNVPIGVVDRVIGEAERFDLREACIIDTFYFAYFEAIKQDPIEEKWLKVKEPYTYTYKGRTYVHQGADRAVLYWAYARFVAQSQTIATPKGLQAELLRGFVSTTSPAIIKEVANEYKVMGGATFDDVQHYIKRSGDFTEFDFSFEPEGDYSKFDRDYSTLSGERHRTLYNNINKYGN